MKQLLLSISLFFILQSMHAQDFVRELDKKTDKVLLRGKIAFDDIMNESTCSWFGKGADLYHPNQQAVDELHKIWPDYRFIVFAGTWCSDTKDMLPKFYKVLVEAGIDLHTVEMFGLNRSKEALNNETTLYSITRVPTIIVMHQFREVGRITENVEMSVEEDLVKIIRKDYDRLEAERANRFH